jgi:hypothetical protein
MRILLRNHGGNEYVWKDATYKDDNYFITANNQTIRIDEVQIVTIDGQAGQGHVVCKCCGELIENNPIAIQAHYEKRERERDCTNCNHLTYSRDKERIERTLVPLGNGKHRIKDEIIAELMCGASGWSAVKLTSPEVNRICVYNKCRRSGVRGPNDIFSKYPGVFDTTITADVLAAKKFKFENYNGSHFVYDMKSRGTIKACVNKSGIVECFSVSSNGNRVRFFYSEKYDKMFYSDGHNYVEGKPYWFREVKFDEAYKKIKALYEGAK